MGSFLFNVFAWFTLITAVGVVVNKNAVNAAMCLLLSLVGVAGLFVGLEAYLLAFLLLLVYAGAIVALFLFIVMLLDTKGDSPPTLHKLPVVASGGISPGVIRIAFGGQTNSQSWHETHFSRPFGSFTSVGTPR